MKRSYQIALTVSSVIIGAGLGLYVMGRTELGTVIKGKLGQFNPVSRDAIHAMNEEVVMRTAQATNNPRINQAWVEKQWESVGY